MLPRTAFFGLLLAAASYSMAIALELNVERGDAGAGRVAVGAEGPGIDVDVDLGAGRRTVGPSEQPSVPDNEIEEPGESGPLHDAIDRLSPFSFRKLVVDCRLVLAAESGVYDAETVRICEIVRLDFNPL